MSSERKISQSSLIQRSDYLIATAGLLVSLLLLLVAGWSAGTPVASEERLMQRSSALAEAQCLDNLQALEIPFVKVTQGIEVRDLSSSALPALMDRATLIQQSCPGYQLQTLCAGAGCDDGPGLALELSNG